MRLPPFSEVKKEMGDSFSKEWVDGARLCYCILSQMVSMNPAPSINGANEVAEPAVVSAPTQHGAAPDNTRSCESCIDYNGANKECDNEFLQCTNYVAREVRHDA